MIDVILVVMCLSVMFYYKVLPLLVPVLMKNKYIQKLVMWILNRNNMFSINKDGNILWIKYTENSREYSIPIPYNRRGKSYILELVRDHKTDTIIYPSGIKFLCTPNQLGCNCVKVTNVMTNIVMCYYNDEIITL